MAWARPDFWRRGSALLLALLGLGALSGVARAGDQANYDVIGYSTDARYFAFEQFGIQDGSGFAYSTIFVIDITADRFVVGTPIEEQAASEDEDLADIRARARADAAPRLADLDIVLAGQLAAAIGDGVPDNDGSKLTFGMPIRFGIAEVTGAFTLELSTFDIASTFDCQSLAGSPALGLVLSMDAGGNQAEFYRDQSLPRSRGCALAYRIAGIFVPFVEPPIMAPMALISVFSHGFEGPDRRFIAIPLAPGIGDQ